MATTKYEKRVVFNGVSNVYTQFMETEDTGVNAPVYDALVVNETPSVQDFDGTAEVTEDPLYLSNVLHDEFTHISAVNINLNAAYLGEGVAEEAQGMISEGAGAWSMPTSPRKKPMRVVLIETDAEDKEVIWIFPKCLLSPMAIGGATRTATATAKIPTHVLKAIPLTYKTSGEPRKPYFKIDLTSDEAIAMWDRELLITTAVYDSATLEACKVTPAP